MNYEKFLKVSATAIFSMVLAACGGGGGGGEGRSSESRDGGSGVVDDERKKPGAQIAPPSSAAAEPTKLKNPGVDCFINATLQILRNDPSLQAKVEADHPGAGFKDFFDAYEARNAYLDGAHAKVTQYIRSRQGVPQGIGTIEEAMKGLGFSTIELTVVKLSEIAKYYKDGVRFFDISGTTSEGPAMNELPSPEQITAVGFYSPNHVYAYVRHHDQWYEVNDTRIEKVSAGVVKAFSIAKGQESRGISFVSYK